MDDLDLKDTEDQLSELQQKALTQLSDEDREKLSKVLFPSTHTTEVEVLGIKRKLSPLPLKIDKEVHAALRPLSEKLVEDLKEAQEDFSKTNYQINDDVIGALKDLAKILARHYKWDDVGPAVDNELLTITEMQSLAYVQQEVQGSNDFLLGTLRTCLRLMQINEIVQVRFQSLLTSRHSAKSGDVALMNS